MKQESQILTETEKSSLITELDMSSDKITKCETQVGNLIFTLTCRLFAFVNVFLNEFKGVFLVNH